MSLTAISQAALAHIVAARDSFALETPTPSEINTDGIVSFFGTKIAPILLAILGIIFIGRASKGEVSKVLTSSAIAVIGLVFIAGATVLFFVGESLFKIVFTDQ